MKTFIQIGTNNGNDEFNSIVKHKNPDLVILVEPNESLNQQIEQSYSYLSGKINNDMQVIIENIAVTTESGPCELVIPKNGITLTNGNHITLTDVNFSLLPMDDWGEEFEKLTVDGITFNELCEKHSITEIDYLQIDTEGLDSQIILSIDFDKIKIKKLKYEVWEFGADCYTRYGEKAKDYGINGMKKVEEKLISLGYKLTNLSTDIEAVLEE